MTSTLRLKNNECRCGRCQKHNQLRRSTEAYENLVQCYMDGKTKVPEWHPDIGYYVEARNRRRKKARENGETYELDEGEGAVRYVLNMAGVLLLIFFMLAGSILLLGAQS